MTYVREQSSTELAVHMRSLQKMPGWHDPLADRLWQEVEALKAEVAGLRTGYEAYEQVVQGLKAEISRLRAKHSDFSTGPAAEDAPYLFSHSLDRKGCTVDFNGTPYHYTEMSEVFVACACGDEYRIDSYGAGFMAANDGVCENCDAANGGVEPVLDTPLSKESAL